MEYELYHHGILGQKWGQRNGPPYPLSGSDHSAAEKRAARYRSSAERAEGKIARNNAKIEKLNSYRNSKRNQKLELKRSKLKIKRERLEGRVNSGRMKRELYAKDPNRRERRAMKKAYKLDTKIARIERKQNIWQQKVNKLEYKNTKLEHKVQKYLAKEEKLRANIENGQEYVKKQLQNTSFDKINTNRKTRRQMTDWNSANLEMYDAVASGKTNTKTLTEQNRKNLTSIGDGQYVQLLEDASNGIPLNKKRLSDYRKVLDKIGDYSADSRDQLHFVEEFNKAFPKGTDYSSDPEHAYSQFVEKYDRKYGPKKKG